MPYILLRSITDTYKYRKFEHSKTFGLVASATSNAIWAPDDEFAGAARQTGSGRAIVGAGEEVLCWDIKKGELLGKWQDSSCKAQVSVLTQSKTDEDIFAVGYVSGFERMVWAIVLIEVLSCS